MLRGLLLCTAGLLTANTVTAGEDKNTVYSKGVAHISCGKYLRDVHLAIVDEMMTSWAMGYLSGINTALMARDVKLLPLPDSESTSAYLQKFCRDNPLSEPADGVALLAAELMGKIPK